MYHTSNFIIHLQITPSSDYPPTPTNESLDSDAAILAELERSRQQRFDPKSNPSELFSKWPCLKEINYVSLSDHAICF